jgi:hypothetical protein
MIRFSCPRCGAVYEVAPHRAGEKLHCLKCQQRLQVPNAALAKTITASPIAPKSIATDRCAPIPASSTTPASKALDQAPAMPALDQRQPNDTQQWYVAKGKQKLGPFKRAELQTLARENRILPTDMLHKEGTPKWIPASSVQGLFTAASPTTSTGPPNVTVQPSTSVITPIAAPFGMSRFVYWCSLVGGWSAFLGWVLTEVLIGRWVGRYFLLAVMMIMVVASAIGAGLSQVEALITSQWQAQRQRFVPGLIGGLVGGLFGGLLGNLMYSLLGGKLAILAFLGRVLG